MDVRQLGHDGPVTSVIGVSGTAFSGAVDVEDCVRVVRHALDLGITLLDTTCRTGHEQVERLVGRAVAGRRGQAVLAAPARPGDGSLARACDAVLRRMAVDHLDVFYLDCPTWTRPIEEGVGELAELVVAGKVRHIGLAEPLAGQIPRVAGQPVSVIACEYSLLKRRAELDLIPAARAHRLGVVARGPLGRGFLAGADRLSAAHSACGDPRRAGLGIAEAGPLAERMRALRAAEEIATQLHLGLARLALVWLLAQGDIVPAPSTRSRVHLEMNASAAAIRPDPALLARLGTLFRPDWGNGTDHRDDPQARDGRTAV
ncbi:aldo/keto reductase [[Actinomadura] parvosata]|uniref:aldo/keto reductase n=1 Tax=[Actinomadura] parvosata TaxID=1955412 RepID=UPI00406C7528